MKIVLAMDQSEHSEAAARFVASKLCTRESEVIVLSIVEPPYYPVPPGMTPGYMPELAPILQEREDHARKAAASTVEFLRSAGFKADAQVSVGESRDGILDFAEEAQADLIVLGSHGLRGLQKFLIGSVAESVSRHARCSVLIVRTPVAK